MKKIMLFAATAAMTLAFAACSDCDDCATAPAVVQTNTAVGVQDALYQGASHITLTENLQNDATFTIPNSYASGQTLTLNIPAGGHSVLIREGSGRPGVLPTLEANIPNAEDLQINTPNMSVNFSGTVGGTLTSSTAANTLTLLKNASVNELVVTKGNVYVYGTVTKYGNIASGSKIVRPVNSAQQLTAALAEDVPQNGGVVLTADIHYTLPTIDGNEENQSAFVIGSYAKKENPATAFESDRYDGYIFDGNGHTLGGAAYNQVLIVYAQKAVVKNLTIEQNAAEKQAALTAHNGNNGLTIYRAKGVVLDNVTVKNTDKAGIIVSSSTVTATNVNTQGNKWGGINVTEGGNPPYGGKPTLDFKSGNLQEVLPAYKIWVDISSLQDQTEAGYSVTVPNGWTNTMNDSNPKEIQRYYYPAN